jgi:DNA-binding transcriptional LysR family regulator
LIDIPPGDKRVTHFILELSVPKLPVGPLRVNSSDAMLPALMAGLGLGVLPEFLIHEAIAGRTTNVSPPAAVKRHVSPGVEM